MAEEQKDEMPSTVDKSDDDEKMEDSQQVDGETPPQRLMITKMELENFKSYGGVKEIGPFHKCFSSVVGPNGSGKSNVIDAMLFVFGKRAKKLRLNKVRELIHKSDGVKDNPPTSARVSVFFQEIIDHGEGDNNFDVVPNTQMVVTRIARKDNSSTYKLNGKNSSFREVASYLGSKGIDLDNNRFLILQGEVEMISMMAPKGKTEDDEGLLEYLEDIIGSSKYVEDTNLAAEKVEQLTEQRQEKLNRVKAVEKEKDNLEGAKLEAEALLGKDREIRRKRNILFQINSMKETKAIESLAEKKSVADENLAAEKEKAIGAKNDVKKLERALNAQHKQYDKICNELKTTKDEFTAYERREIKLQGEIKHAKGAVKKAKTKVSTETKKEADASKKVEEAKESIPELEEQRDNLVERKAEEDEKLDKIQDEVNETTKAVRTKLEEKTAELAPVDQELSEFKNQLNTTRTEINLLEKSTTQNKKRLEESEKELASLDDRQQSKRDEKDKSEGELEQAQSRLQEINRETTDLQRRENDLKQKSNDLMRQLEEAKAAKEFSAGGRSAVVKNILQAAKKGGALSHCGVLGRLGDLCSTTAEFDVAASNACGSWDHIVVRTTSGAQQILEWLRKNKAGRANFIPLDKMKKGLHDRPVSPPEGGPRLYDQIAPCNGEIAPALFMAVQNTLVAPDLDAASRWAFNYGKRWRVVTVDGNIIETSGTMQGGGNQNQVKRGLIRVSNGKQPKAIPLNQASGDDCKKLEQEARKAQDLLQQSRQCLKDFTTERRKLEQLIKTLRSKIPKLELEIKTCDASREQLTKLIPELRSKCSLSAEEKANLKDLHKQENKIKSDMASCEKQASKLKAEVAKLQKSILDAGGSKLKKQQAAVDKVDAALNEAEEALTAATVAIKTNTKAAQKAKKQIAAAEKQQTESIELLAEKEEELKGMQNDAEKLAEAYEKVKALEAEKKEELDTAKKECEELKKTVAEAKCAEIELTGKVEDFARQISDCKGRRKQWEKQIKKLLKDAAEDDEFDFSDDEDGDEEDKKAAAGGPPVDNDGDVEMEPVSDSKNNKPKEDKAESKSSLPTLSFAVLEKYCVDDIKGGIDTLESERNTLAKVANMGAIEEYRKKEADYLARVGELDEVTEQRNACRKEHEELRRKRLEMFMDGFGKITLKLKEMYQMITLGGDAELELVDTLDPFSEGIVFSVRPPKKSWKNISNLSGGEKTLSSLALVFALHHYKPTPLYVMDEIDAALDFKNVSIVANYIKERTKNAQFIIISLRNNMFELADRLVGIYKTNNSTKSITISPKNFACSASTANQNGHAGTPSGRAALFGDKTNGQGQSAATSTVGSKRQRSMSASREVNAA